MAVKFYNIRTGEEQVAVTEPQISAMLESSDRSSNITQGQDFGWRLAPEVVVQMDKIKQNYKKMQEIADRLNIPFEDVTEAHVIDYISSRTPIDKAPVAKKSDYTDTYQAKIQELKEKGTKKKAVKKSEEINTENSSE